jgi:hypothetical protein
VPGPEHEAAWKRAAEVKAAHEQELLALPGVFAVGLGPKKKGGEWMGDEPAIVVFTTHKTSDIPPEQRIPKEIEGVPTDVEERARPGFAACPPDGAADFDKSKHDRLQGGIRIGSKDVINQSGVVTTYKASGTGGCMARIGTGAVDQRTVVMLTCYHVVVDPCLLIRTDAGQSVGHPTHYHCSSCSACCTNLIGRTLRIKQELDYAAIAIDKDKEWLAEIAGAHDNGNGTFSNVAVKGMRRITSVPAGGIHVRKRGMRTGLREGTLRAIGLTVPWTDCGPMSSLVEHDAMSIDSIGNDWFACKGDSGSAVLNDADEVVGIVSRGAVATAHAINIGAIIDDFATAGLTLEIASAATLNQVRVAPEPAGVPPAQEKAAVELGAFGSVPPLFITRLEQARDELTATARGREYAAAIERHAEEARELVNSNRKCATVWRRAGGPEIVHAALAALQNDDARLPQSIGGQSFAECVRRIADIFARYGSSDFARDIARYYDDVARSGGMSYRDLKAALT